MSEIPDRVQNPSAAYVEMESEGEWQLLADLVGGTRAMRNNDEWTPRNKSEGDQNYQARVGRSFLFSGLYDTLYKTAAKPFGKPVTVTPENLGDSMDALIMDVDGTSLELTQFANNIMFTAEQYGMTHIMADNPVVPEGTRKDQEQELNIRPSIFEVAPPNLFAWTVDNTSGSPDLLEIRYTETVVEKVGLWTEVVHHQIKVWTKETVETYRKNKKGDYKFMSQVPNGLGKIPIVTYYTNRQGFMVALPPFLQLAWMNLAHWQSYSEQRNILHFARVPILHGSGFDQKTVDAGIIVSSAKAILNTGDSSLGYVEPQGQGIDSGRQDLQDLEDRMAILGMQPMLERSINTTATAENISEAKSQAQIQSWIRGLEKALEDIYGIAAEWQGSELPEDFKIDIYSDFVPGISDAQRQANMNQAFVVGAIDRKTWLYEAKRSGFISPDTDIDDVDDAAESDPNLTGATDNLNEGEEEVIEYITSDSTLSVSEIQEVDSNITFQKVSDNTEILRIEPDGTVFVKGHKAIDDEDIKAGFRAWMKDWGYITEDDNA